MSIYQKKSTSFLIFWFEVSPYLTSLILRDGIPTESYKKEIEGAAQFMKDPFHTTEEATSLCKNPSVSNTLLYRTISFEPIMVFKRSGD